MLHKPLIFERNIMSDDGIEERIKRISEISKIEDEIEREENNQQSYAANSTVTNAFRRLAEIDTSNRKEFAKLESIYKIFKPIMCKYQNHHLENNPFTRPFEDFLFDASKQEEMSLSLSRESNLSEHDDSAHLNEVKRLCDNIFPGFFERMISSKEKKNLIDCHRRHALIFHVFNPEQKGTFFYKDYRINITYDLKKNTYEINGGYLEKEKHSYSYPLDGTYTTYWHDDPSLRNVHMNEERLIDFLKDRLAHHLINTKNILVPHRIKVLKTVAIAGIITLATLFSKCSKAEEIDGNEPIAISSLQGQKNAPLINNQQPDLAEP